MAFTNDLGPRSIYLFSKMGDSAPKKSSGILRKLFDLLLLGGLVGISIYLIVDAQNRKDEENVNPVEPNYR